MCNLHIIGAFLSRIIENGYPSERVHRFPRVVEGEEREKYKPFLTPVSDVATECYCYTEDTVIAAGIGVVYVVLLGGMIMAESDVNSDNVDW